MASSCPQCHPLSSPEIPEEPFFLGDSITRSFGIDRPTFYPSTSRRLWRRLALARDGGFWSGEVQRYKIEHLTASGARTLGIHRTTPLFPERENPESHRASTGEPTPMISDLFEDDAGRLWVLSLIADRRWRSAAGRPRRSADGQQYFVATDLDRYYDTLIEVIDLRRRELLASERIDIPTPFFIGDGLVGAPRDGDTHTRVQIWQTRLTLR